MTDRLKKAVRKQKQNTKQHIPPIHGSLGIRLGGSKLVEVPTRNSFVYVRLRNNDSEVIQAFNNQVAPAYNLPVIVERQGNRYTVVSVDTERYENNWNSFAPFLPRHGNTHSFDLESGGGGDIVWVYPRQFTPLLVLPSGSLGAGNVVVSSYTLKKDNNSWLYTGNTGTSNLTPYNPSTGAVMVLVYLDANTGNPGLVVGSGTYFSQTITGTSAVVPYIPSVPNPSTQIPLAAVRLVTGTSQISWNNIYDVRQFLHTVPTGTGGGGGVATGTDYDSVYLRLDTSNNPLTDTLQIRPPESTRAIDVELEGNGVILDFVQITTPSGTLSVPSAQFSREEADTDSSVSAPFIKFNQNFDLGGVADTASLLEYYSNSVLRTLINPSAQGTGTTTMFDGDFTLSGDGNILLLKTNGSPRTKIAAQGNIELGLNVAKEPNAGKIGYNLFNTGYLYIVGAGTASNDRRVQIYDKLYVSDLVEASSFNLTNPSLSYNITGSPHVHTQYLPFGVNDAFNPLTVNSNPYAATVDQTMRLIKWSNGVFLLGTNDGSNYWNFTLTTLAGTPVASMNTSALAGGAGHLISTTSFSPSSVGTSDVILYIACTKTGAPGTLYVYGPALQVRI